MFPFSKIAPQQLLSKINPERHRKTQRGILEYILNNTLVKSYEKGAGIKDV